MSPSANITGLITSWNLFRPIRPSLVVVGLALVGTICAVARKIFSADGEVLMTYSSENHWYLREGWVSYTPKGDYFPKWYKVSLTNYQNACRCELNFYSCESGFEAHGESIDMRPYINKFPRVIQKGGELHLVAKEQAKEGKEGEEKELQVKKIEDEELCHSYLIAQGGHQHEKAYGIAWKRFFFGRLFG